jgi:hypothetical protein
MLLNFWNLETARNISQSMANQTDRTHYIHGNERSGYTVNETPGTFLCERVIPNNRVSLSAAAAA